MELAAPASSPSRLGHVYHTRPKRFRPRQPSICIADEGGTVKLHMAKTAPELTVPVADLPTPSNGVPVDLSPPARLLFAAAAQTEDAIKADWDLDVVRTAAAEQLEQSLSARRQLAIESLDLGWINVFDWIDLTESEKAWYRAHDAARVGDLDDLATQTAALPQEGYPDRVRLLLLHIDEIAADLDTWRSLLVDWAEASVPLARELADLLTAAPEQALGAAADLLTKAGEPDRADAWRAARDQLGDPSPHPPLVVGRPAWSALHAYRRGMAGEQLDADLPLLAAAPPELIDDLVDGGALNENVDLDAAPEALRPHLAARLDPGRLDDADLTAVGAVAERARRFFLERDRAGLQALERTPDVQHYLALLDVIDGNEPDSERLRPDAVEVLQMASEAVARARDGGSFAVPGPVMDDPTLWPVFAPAIRRHELQLAESERIDHPAFARWFDLNRLLGLLWQGDWQAAVALGEELAPALDDERLQDEALSLTAFALDQLGRDEEALDLLEEALEGNYTEALLVNTSILASKVTPDSAARHFARIVSEAPTNDLKVAAVRRAVSVWDTGAENPNFPPELKPPLQDALSGPASIEDYVELIRVGAVVAPDVVVTLPDPGGDLRHVYRYHRARARFREEPNFSLEDWAKECVAVHKAAGQESWFESDWAKMVDLLFDLVAVDFGEAGGAATFIDTIHVSAPSMFTLPQRLFLVPQAGAHLAGVFAEDDSTLSDAAFKKFFYEPVEEFLSRRESFEPERAQFLADNLSLTLGFSALNYLNAGQVATGRAYNPLVERVRWDTERRYAILREMRNVLDQAMRWAAEVDRMIDRLERLPANRDGHHEVLATLREGAREWRDEVVKLRAEL